MININREPRWGFQAELNNRLITELDSATERFDSYLAAWLLGDADPELVVANRENATLSASLLNLSRYSLEGKDSVFSHLNQWIERARPRDRSLLYVGENGSRVPVSNLRIQEGLLYLDYTGKKSVPLLRSDRNGKLIYMPKGLDAAISDLARHLTEKHLWDGQLSPEKTSPATESSQSQVEKVASIEGIGQAMAAILNMLKLNESKIPKKITDFYFTNFIENTPPSHNFNDHNIAYPTTYNPLSGSFPNRHSTSSPKYYFSGNHNQEEEE